MFHSIKGILEEIHADYIILETEVFGYKVHTPKNLGLSLSGIGHEAKLLLYPIFREDDVILYGFSDEMSRDLFEMVMKVSGIGPKTALAILSELGTDGLIRAVNTQDQRALTKAPGIGKKGAERMIVELKDKFKHLSPVQTAPQDSLTSLQNRDQLYNEASEALMALGFSYLEASHMIDSAIEDNMDLESLLKKALSGGIG